jgi:hypothetical protein
VSDDYQICKVCGTKIFWHGDAAWVHKDPYAATANHRPHDARPAVEPTTPPATVPREGYAAWLIENGKKQGEGLAYLRMGYAGMFTWTEDPHAALHFCRRSDAEAVSAECEDAWRIVEHWFATKS